MNLTIRKGMITGIIGAVLTLAGVFLIGANTASVITVGASNLGHLWKFDMM